MHNDQMKIKSAYNGLKSWNIKYSEYLQNTHNKPLSKCKRSLEIPLTTFRYWIKIKWWLIKLIFKWSKWWNQRVILISNLCIQINRLMQRIPIINKIQVNKGGIMIYNYFNNFIWYNIELKRQISPKVSTFEQSLKQTLYNFRKSWINYTNEPIEKVSSS